MIFLELTIPLWKAMLILLAVILLNYRISKFNWSKVEKGKKPIGWWYHKIMCELWYNFNGYMGGYYKHLNKMCDKYNFNLYGKRWRTNK